MTDRSLRKGWCPGLHAPMEAHDGLLVRVSPPSGHLNTEQVRFLAESALWHGNGRALLTSRGNIQFRGFSASGARDFVQAATAAGLGDVDPVREVWRSAVAVSPLAGLDKACAPETSAIANALSRTLAQVTFPRELPAKFSFAVDGGGIFPVGSLRADVMIQAAGSCGWRVVCGAESRNVPTASSAIKAAITFVQSWCMGPDARRPLKSCTQPEAAMAVSAGTLCDGYRSLGVPLGILNADMLFALANTRCDVRLTPWRCVIVPHDISLSGFIMRADDPRLRIDACPGNTGCERGTTDTPADARALAEVLPAGMRLHVSGCKKGCARASGSDVTLVARAGRYDMIMNGCAGDVPSRTGLLPTDVRRRLQKMVSEGKATS